MFVVVCVYVCGGVYGVCGGVYGWWVVCMVCEVVFVGGVGCVWGVRGGERKCVLWGVGGEGGWGEVGGGGSGRGLG